MGAAYTSLLNGEYSASQMTFTWHITFGIVWEFRKYNVENFILGICIDSKSLEVFNIFYT